MELRKPNSVHVPDIPRALHVRVRKAAANAETTIRNWVIKALEEKLERESQEVKH